MQKISFCEVEFHPHSFGDQQIRLFQWNGQIYRGIGAKAALHFKKLFQNGTIQQLVDKGLLIESEPTLELEIDLYEIVVHHRKISFTSYPNEWCAEMLKDAALTLINLAIELSNDNLTLADAHPWNLLIDVESCKPIFVDLGSIIPIQAPVWTAYDEFCRYCFYPLILMSQGQDQIGRLLMCEDKGVLKPDLVTLTQGKALSSLTVNLSRIRRFEIALRQRLPQSGRKQLKKVFSSIHSLIQQLPEALQADFLEETRRRSHSQFLAAIRTEVESIKLQHSESLQRNQPSFSSQDIWSVKQQHLEQILKRLEPNSVLDIGSGTGWYSKLAARLGSKVVAFDVDQECITQLYFDALHQQLPILPLVMDFTKTTPARGLANHWAIAATDRFQCDLVLALGLLHQIVLDRRLNFDQIVEGLGLFSKRWAVVEFIPPEDQELEKTWLSQVTWYKLDYLIDALKRQFYSVSILPSHPEPRVLLLCEK